MNVTVRNRSRWSDESVQGLVDFLLPCYADAPFPVQLTFFDGKCLGAYGRAHHPRRYDRRGIKKGVVQVYVRIGQARETYPYACTYKKSSGAAVYNNQVEEVLHVTAHELRHVEQYAAAWHAGLDQADRGLLMKMRFSAWFRRYERNAFRRGSCEVDAEDLAHKMLDAYRYMLERRVA
jgi:hypothetical protein